MDCVTWLTCSWHILVLTELYQSLGNQQPGTEISPVLLQVAHTHHLGGCHKVPDVCEQHDLQGTKQSQSTPDDSVSNYIKLN